MGSLVEREVVMVIAEGRATAGLRGIPTKIIRAILCLGDFLVRRILEHSKVYIPSKLQSRVVAWYHEYLVHPGEKRTEETIRQNLTWPGLRTQV